MNKAYLAIIPGICIMFSVLSFMILGNGLEIFTRCETVKLYTLSC